MKMNQILKLRELIQAEIEYALQEETGYRFSCETKEHVEKKWASFIESFVD